MTLTVLSLAALAGALCIVVGVIVSDFRLIRESRKRHDQGPGW